MNYQDVLNMCRNASLAMNANGFFMHGRIEDYSLHFDEPAYRAGECGIGLIMPTPKISVQDTIRIYQLFLLFMVQDAPDSTELEREQIVANMDLLSHNYVNYIKANYQIEILSHEKVPDIRNFQGTLSGISLNLTIKTLNIC